MKITVKPGVNFKDVSKAMVSAIADEIPSSATDKEGSNERITSKSSGKSHLEEQKGSHEKLSKNANEKRTPPGEYASGDNSGFSEAKFPVLQSKTRSKPTTTQLKLPSESMEVSLNDNQENDSNITRSNALKLKYSDAARGKHKKVPALVESTANFPVQTALETPVESTAKAPTGSKISSNAMVSTNKTSGKTSIDIQAEAPNEALVDYTEENSVEITNSESFSDSLFEIPVVEVQEDAQKLKVMTITNGKTKITTKIKSYAEVARSSKYQDEKSGSLTPKGLLKREKQHIPSTHSMTSIDESTQVTSEVEEVAPAQAQSTTRILEDPKISVTGDETKDKRNRSEAEERRPEIKEVVELRVEKDEAKVPETRSSGKESTVRDGSNDAEYITAPSTPADVSSRTIIDVMLADKFTASSADGSETALSVCRTAAEQTYAEIERRELGLPSPEFGLLSATYNIPADSSSLVSVDFIYGEPKDMPEPYFPLSVPSSLPTILSSEVSSELADEKTVFASKKPGKALTLVVPVTPDLLSDADSDGFIPIRSKSYRRPHRKALI